MESNLLTETVVYNHLFPGQIRRRRTKKDGLLREEADHSKISVSFCLPHGCFQRNEVYPVFIDAAIGQFFAYIRTGTRYAEIVVIGYGQQT